MSTYQKTHSKEVAAEGHLKNIKKRGGKGHINRQGSKLQVQYEFPDSPGKKKKAKKRK